MAPYCQAATLIASPSFPNAIAWSSENLVAVASGHIVTILNPAVLEGPRGLVGLHQRDPFPIGVVNRDDLFDPCLVSTCLARDAEPCARSISWSPRGLTPNYGCLLAICTVDGYVKLYRSPSCEFRDEWIEVADISLLLFNYYKNIKFGEDDDSHWTFQKDTNIEQTQVLGSTHELQESLAHGLSGRRKRKPSRVDDFIYDDKEDGLVASKDADFSLKPHSKLKKKSLKKIVKPRHGLLALNGQGSPENIKASLPTSGENKSLSLITAKQYACRNALLSSLIVAWSPVVSSDRTYCGSRYWCILAVGSKSGKVSFWKLHKPEYYTIDVGMVTSDPILMGVFQAHKTWIAAISWAVFPAASSESSLILATGSSDGSVKIWSGNIEGLNQCSSAEEVPFSLVAEVTTDMSAPVSSISLSVPDRPQDVVNLAIGRVSGSLETWKWNTCSNRIENTSACLGHDQVVTGLSWGFDGYCLYSCSQDSSVRCWISHENHLEEIPVHTDFPDLKELADLSEVSDRCFGLSLAPGEQMIAVVHRLNPNLLDQMYQARTQKALVEFIWIGGQFVGIPQSAILPTSNFLWWGSNILWSLKKYENGKRNLVLWDVTAALQGFKQSAPTFLQTLMHIWISTLFSDDPQSVSLSDPFHLRHDMMVNVSLRKLHLLNIICRKVMLNNHAQCAPGAENGIEVSSDFWTSLLVSSEREIRERLVAFTFVAVLKRLNSTSIGNSWFPVGVDRMDSWVSTNIEEVHNQLKSLRSRVKDLGSRINSVCECCAEETCPYCSAPVHFEFPDVAICSGYGPSTTSTERHKLSRCRASMRLCSVLQPAWHCVCCGGTVDKLLPEPFFTMPASPLDANCEEDEYLDLSAAAVPLCPFCGIQLQRSMPNFLLSISPV